MAVKLVVSAALIGFVVYHVDVGEAGRSLAGADVGLLAVAAVVACGQFLIAAWRWMVICRMLDAPLPFGQGLKIFWVGAFVGLALPSSAGDAVRAVKAHRAGQALGRAISGVLLDRVTTLVALVLWILVSVPWLSARLGDTVPWGAWPVLAGAMAAILGAMTLLDRLPASWRRGPLTRGVAALAQDTRRLYLVPRHAAAVMGLALLSHGMLVVMAYVLSQAVGSGIGLVDCLLLFPLVVLASAVPISIGGWGVREGAMVAAFGLAGVSAESALVTSVLFGLLVTGISLPGGVMVFSGRPKTMTVQ